MEREAEIIRRKRREQNLSQEYMALELGISQKAYCDIENGKTRLKNEILCKIARILSVKPSEICPISNLCSSNNHVRDKHDALITFLKLKKIDFPEEFI